MNPNESKMNPNESKMNPNESKMNPNEYNKNNIIKKEYKCTYCVKLFSSNSNLYKHIKNICKAKKLDDCEKK
jgi:5-methylcytosine-specific restriction endonuclease McrA